MDACSSDWLRDNCINSFDIRSCFPGGAFVALVWILGIVLLVVGIERVISGIFEHHPGRSRWGSVGLGILVIILAIIVIAFPASVGVFLVILLAIALLFDGIARLIHGFSERTSGKGHEIFKIVVGVFEIALSIAIMAAPWWGQVLSNAGSNRAITIARHPNYRSGCNWNSI